ncbi:MAG: hypothetical protein HY026_03820 [Deltaproteobacteria bacterium]|nr:hypothetical protein [Deltaproteobacteria bacterium]
MIDKVTGFMVQLKNMPKAQAIETAKIFIPKLKQWRSK